MSKFVKIITNDVRFSRMLTLELADIGVTVSDIPKSPDSSDEYYLAADLNCITQDELSSYSSVATVIGFLDDGAELDGDKAIYCSSLFMRPFLMSEFLSVFGGGEGLRRIDSQSRTHTAKRSRVLTMDEGSSSALWGDLRIPLSEYEYRVLALLCGNRGEIVEREKIDAILGVDNGNMGDVYICHLRRKIDNKLGLKLIYTIRGKGYMLKN